MNDTITPEERESWTHTATARINSVTPEKQCEITAQERLVKALKALEASEAQVARLTAERDWLAERCSECCEDADMYSDTHEKRIVLWVEAARKAVAGEGK